MIVDATRICQLLVGLPRVTVLGVGAPIVVHIETQLEVPEQKRDHWRRYGSMNSRTESSIPTFIDAAISCSTVRDTATRDPHLTKGSVVSIHHSVETDY